MNTDRFSAEGYDKFCADDEHTPVKPDAFCDECNAMTAFSPYVKCPKHLFKEPHNKAKAEEIANKFCDSWSIMAPSARWLNLTNLFRAFGDCEFNKGVEEAAKVANSWPGDGEEITDGELIAKEILNLRRGGKGAV